MLRTVLLVLGLFFLILAIALLVLRPRREGRVWHWIFLSWGVILLILWGVLTIRHLRDAFNRTSVTELVEQAGFSRENLTITCFAGEAGEGTAAFTLSGGAADAYLEAMEEYGLFPREKLPEDDLPLTYALHFSDGEREMDMVYRLSSPVYRDIYVLWDGRIYTADSNGIDLLEAASGCDLTPGEYVPG